MGNCPRALFSKENKILFEEEKFLQECWQMLFHELAKTKIHHVNLMSIFASSDFNTLYNSPFASNFFFKDSGISGGGGRGIRIATLKAS